MPDIRDFPATGKVTAAKDAQIVFCPANTNYEIYLAVSSPYTGPLNKPIQAIIRVNARKLYTVPSGGGFISPIFGPPKIIQGRVRYLDDRSIVLQAGTSIVAQLPAKDTALDLESGAISVGSLVNVVALPGATFELLQPALTR